MTNTRIQIVLLLVAVALVGCQAAPTATPPPTAAAGPTTSPGTMPVGQVLFVEQGCAGCHGEDGRGISGGAPPVVGESPEEIVAQVRNPRDRMPAYPPERLSDADLAEIVAYIQALSSASSG